MAPRPKPTRAEIVIIAAAVVMIVFSFFDFGGDADMWDQLWFPLATLLPLYALVMGVHIAMTRFLNTRLPDTIGTFTWEQVHVVLGVMAAAMGVAWVIANTGPMKVGLWVEVLGSFALAAGALMLQRERRTGAVG